MIDVDARSREKMWKILCFLDISDTSKSSSSSLVLLHGSCGIAIRICSTSETVLRASIVLCSTCLENSIDYGYQYQCYHPGDYITSGSRSDQKDLLVCLTFVYPIIPEYPIQIWTLQVITMLSIRWTTHMIHIEAPAKIITLIWLHCVPENHNSCTRNAVMCWTTDLLLLKQNMYTSTPPMIFQKSWYWLQPYCMNPHHTICCIQNVLPEEVPRWHISNKRNLEQITNSRTLPHPHPSWWWQQLHPINCIPSIFEPTTSNFKYSLPVVIEPKSENASSALAYLDGDFFLQGTAAKESLSQMVSVLLYPRWLLVVSMMQSISLLTSLCNTGCQPWKIPPLAHDCWRMAIVIVIVAVVWNVCVVVINMKVELTVWLCLCWGAVSLLAASLYVWIKR